MVRSFALLTATLFILAGPALAKGKPENVGMPKKLVTLDKDRQGKGQHGKPEMPGQAVTSGHGVFDQAVRERVRGYYATEARGGHCPPGLARKNNGCLPPGQAGKRYEVGEILPADVRIGSLPRRLRDSLPPPPEDSYYGVVDGAIVRVGRATGKVLEAVDILSGF
ncbi:MAG: hypothetical protein H6851_13835 [Geminicoccaceae bacterium]|nr:hypothetical protein [Geminicoccaceae bacterium]MCB9944685.1 hypothetical protein [Geminicoccaceae bacterium]